MKMDYITFIFSSTSEAMKIDNHLKKVLGLDYKSSSNSPLLLVQQHFNISLKMNFKGIYQLDGINLRTTKGQVSLQFSGEFFISRTDPEMEIVDFSKKLNEIEVDYKIARVDYQATMEVDPLSETELFQDMSHLKLIKNRSLKNIEIGELALTEYRKVSNSRNAMVLYNKTKQINKLKQAKKEMYSKEYPAGKNYLRLEIRSVVTTNNLLLEKALKSELVEEFRQYYKKITSRWIIPKKITKIYGLK